MKRLLLAIALTTFGCATTGDTVAINEDICSYEMHWDTLQNVCWAENWLRDGVTKYLRQIPVPCSVVQACLGRISTEGYYDGTIK